jgi:hypothetical protein
MLTKEQLRAKSAKFERRYLDVPLLDGSSVLLQSLTKGEQREIRNAVKKKDGTVDPKLNEFSNDLLLVRCIVDGVTKERVYTDDDALLGIFDLWDTQDTAVLIDAAIEHTGILLDMKEVEARLKNSRPTPGNGSSGVTA